MAAYVFVALLFIAKTAVLAQQSPPQECETKDCVTGSLCRYVLHCSTCNLEARCIPIGVISEGLDSECRNNNSQVILKESSRRRSPYLFPQCPSGCPGRSRCVFASNSEGSCCTKPTNQEPVGQKRGFCPTGGVSYCGDIKCQNDYDCPDNLKCCPECNNRCAKPVNYQDLCGTKVCPPDQTCVQKPRFCPPGMICIQSLIPTCVPIKCATCGLNETCTRTRSGYQCINMESVDLCGGCPVGQVCRDTGIRCVTQPCPSYQCFPQ